MGEVADYRLADGTSVPRVSEIAGWAQSSGEAERLADFAVSCEVRGQRWRDERERYAQIGTRVHELIEYAIRGETHPVASTDGDAHALVACQAWTSWWAEYRPTPLACEVRLVSERHRFGGTVDLVASIDGRVVVVDWKTGSQVKRQHWVQIAAYRELVRENAARLGLDGHDVDACAIVRLDKRGRGYEHRTCTDLDAATTMFFSCLQLHRLAPVVRSRRAERDPFAEAGR